MKKKSISLTERPHAPEVPCDRPQVRAYAVDRDNCDYIVVWYLATADSVAPADLGHPANVLCDGQDVLDQIGAILSPHSSICGPSLILDPGFTRLAATHIPDDVAPQASQQCRDEILFLDEAPRFSASPTRTWFEARAHSLTYDLLTIYWSIANEAFGGGFSPDCADACDWLHPVMVMSDGDTRKALTDEVLAIYDDQYHAFCPIDSGYNDLFNPFRA